MRWIGRQRPEQRRAPWSGSAYRWTSLRPDPRWRRRPESRLRLAQLPRQSGLGLQRPLILLLQGGLLRQSRLLLLRRPPLQARLPQLAPLIDHLAAGIV